MTMTLWPSLSSLAFVRVFESLAERLWFVLETCVPPNPFFLSFLGLQTQACHIFTVSCISVT